MESTPAAPLRALDVAPTRLRRVTWASLGALYVIVATGAAVRLTASGLGCDSWPGCERGRVFPEKDYHAYIEFGNRVIGGVTIMATLAAFVAALVTPRLALWAKWLAFGVFAGTLAQAPLGFLTVKLHLHPLSVMAHLLLSFAVLGGAVVLALEARGLERGHTQRLVPRELVRLGEIFTAACFVLVVSGTLATAAGPHSGGEDVRRFGTPARTIFLHAGGVALFGAAFLFSLGYLASRRERSPRLFRLALGLLGLLAVQMAIGEVQYRTDLPWWLVLVHVALAALTWAWTVALATLFRRPLASLAPAGGT